jgi:WD40 repeat protein
MVRLTTLDGAAVPGREIHFRLSGLGSIDLWTQRTDTAGVASPGTWTLGTAAGRETLTARADGVPEVVFTAVAQPGRPAIIAILAGDNQTAAVGAPLPTPLQLKVTDQYRNPVPGESVTYAVVAGNGVILGDSAKTDSSGVASSGVWTLGGAGGQVVRASAAGKDTLFQAFACGDPCRGRDLLFVDNAGELNSLVDGVTSPLISGAMDAAWSPDGKRIAVTVYNRDNDAGDLWLVNADGSNATLRATGFRAPSWSPDGDRLAVAGPEGVYVLNAGDQTPAVLLAEHWGQLDPAWSPDGTKIAFVAAGDVYSLEVMNADGSSLSTLHSDPFILHPTWSPDGQRLAFTKCLDFHETCDIFAVSAAGANLVQLTTVGGAYAPAWSPDGSRIAFGWGGHSFWVPADGSLSQPVPLIQNVFMTWRP